jgi:hypothetical protein
METIDTFRNFNPQTGDLVFWGRSYNVLEVVKEVERILPIAEDALNRITAWPAARTPQPDRRATEVGGDAP